MNYDRLAADYFINRRVSNTVKVQLLSELDLSKNYSVLEFGCGTGNYTKFINTFPNINIMGLDKSELMLKYFKENNPNVLCLIGSDQHIPVPANSFDYVFMVDVIHHISDLSIFFKELYRVLKKDGIICICTENSEQLKEKYWISYFPSIIKIDEERFWEINKIKKEANNQNLNILKETTVKDIIVGPITSFFMNQIRKRMMSVLQLIPDKEYLDGLNCMEQDYEDKKVVEHTRGYTFIWLKKGGL